MTYPILNSTSMETVHPQLHNAWVDVVAHYGADPTWTTDSTAAIQAAVDATLSNNTYRGTVFFPAGTYKVSGPITIGDGTDDVFSLNIIGQRHYGASNGPFGGVSLVMETSAANESCLVFNPKPTPGNMSVFIDGIQVSYTTKGTGSIGIDFTGGGVQSQLTGVVIENCMVQKADVGIALNGGVNVRLSNVSVNGCNVGMHLPADGSYLCNAYSFENCYFQSCVTAGLHVENALDHARFDSCVFQSNSGPGFLNETAVGVRNVSFQNCWWEFPGSDMIQAKGGWTGATFIACRFDGSNGSGGRHVFNNAADDASSVVCNNLVFIGCYVANLNGGNFLNLVNADPSVANDPCFRNIVVLGLYGTPNEFQGIQTPNLSGEQFSVFHGHEITEARIPTNAVNGFRPAYKHLWGGADVNVNDGLGAIDFTEQSSDVAAGSTDHARLYARDNGAGKTQLVVRFPTGAVQVIATQP